MEHMNISIPNSLDDILLLGDPRLHVVCDPTTPGEVPALLPLVEALADLVRQFRERYGAGRAIAAPQVGVMKRLVVMNIDRPIALFNPEIIAKSEALFELWDDCMSFPNLLVRLCRHREISVRFRDVDWQTQVWRLRDDLAELLQHEIDHLDGVLATMRAIDAQSFRWRPSPQG
jgi:peptide deformylase